MFQTLAIRLRLNYLLTIGSRVFLNSTFHGIAGILISRKLIDCDCLDNFKADLLRFLITFVRRLVSDYFKYLKFGGIVHLFTNIKLDEYNENSFISVKNHSK